MSFILDALRKSEHERQRQGGPGIADLKAVAVAGRLPVWALALGALLLINIAVVLVLVLRDEPAPQADGSLAAGQSVTAAAAPSASGTTGTAPVPASAPPAPDYVLPPPVLPRSRPQTEFAGEPGFESPGQGGAVPARADPELSDVMPSVTPPARSNEDNLPTLNDVMMQGSGRIPELHLDIHVYSAQPAGRFVFLNNRKYREGSETPEGTRIERITPDGVVLNHRGLRFLMPRQ